jgi:hypothetical protein
MSEENKKIVRRWLMELWSNQGDAGLAVADEIIAPHYHDGR